MTMTLGSLFDGSGGFPLAGVLHGITPVWASEIEKFPIAVTKARFPHMTHLGDVTKIDGGKIEPVDVITFGSPCQDMSVAGKRAGMKHEEHGADDTTRSGLFYEAIRIIREMREATDGRYPTFAVWENVPGAFTSNGGEDFRCVLESLVQVKDQTFSVPRPDGRWANAGLIMGDGFSVAWRILNAEYFGVPQRRRRIYLVADFGGERAGEILFEREGVPGDSAPRGETREGTADDAPGSAGRSCCVKCLNPWDCQGIRQYDVNGVYPTVSSNVSGGQNRQGVVYSLDSLSSNSMKSSNPYSGFHETDVAKCIDTSDGNPSKNQGGNVVVQRPICFHCQQDPISSPDIAPCIGGQGQATVGVTYTIAEDGRANAEVCEELSPTLKTRHPHTVAMFMGGQGAKARSIAYSEKIAPTLKATPSGSNTIPDIVYAIQGNGIDRADNAGCEGRGWREGKCYTLNTVDRPAICFANRPFNAGDVSVIAKTLCAQELSKQPGVTVCYDARGNGNGRVCPTLTGDHQNRVTDYTALCVGNGQLNQIAMSDKSNALDCMHDQQAVLTSGKPPRKYIVRRLTPTECARLQGFPSNWTDGVDGSDSAKYKLWGNGICLWCAEFVLGKIVKVVHNH